jgi:hypothetical protein
MLMPPNDLEDLQRPQRTSAEGADASCGKIIDFFAAKEALRAEAKALEKQMEMQQQIRAAARQRMRVYLPDPWEYIILLLLLVVAVAVGLLVISGFG